MLTELSVKNYRSIYDLHIKLKPVTVILGPNGSGKSNLYKSLSLLSRAARGDLASAIAEEGGVSSALWSGRKAKGEKRELSLSVKTDQFQYELVMGMVPPTARGLASFFSGDLDIKREKVRKVTERGKSLILKRGRQNLEVKDSNGERLDYTNKVPLNESVLNRLQEPHKYPELAQIKRELSSWRFYHNLRTDSESPMRMPQPGVVSPSLSDDGSNLVAVLATILCGYRRQEFIEALNQAFPGARVIIENSRFALELSLEMQGIRRPLTAWELSDGTLQFLALLAILFSPEPPPFIAINEPETSIHEDLLEPLARAIVEASSMSQVWITTHSRHLSDYILDYGGYEEITLEKVKGQTRLKGYGLDGLSLEEDDDVDDQFDED